MWNRLYLSTSFSAFGTFVSWVKMASEDVASKIWQALGGGA